MPISTRLSVLATALDPDPRRAAMLARASGFTGIEFDAFSPALDLTTLSQTGRREFAHVLSSQDQRLVALQVDVGPKGFGPGADIDRLLAQFRRVMEAAKGLLTPLVCVEAGPLPEPAIAAKPKSAVTPDQAGLIIIPSAAAATQPQGEPARPGPDPAVVSHVDTALAALGALTDRIGVILAFRSDLASFAALDRALAAAACPSFGVDFDPVALLRDAWDRDEIFSRFGALIRHVRARDALVGSDRRTRPAPIGRGSTDWPALLAAIDAAGYAGWLGIDPTELPDRAAAAAAGAKFLSSV
jgi:sugar phosphate isomerase/epimerase